MPFPFLRLLFRMIPESTTLEPPAVLLQDYTRPGDPDSAAGIRLAIDEARRRHSRTILFESGRYILRSSISHATEGIVHDADSKDVQPRKDVHLLVDAIADLTLQGATCPSGEPATILVGWNDGGRHGFLPSILWCENSPRLTLCNLGFTREPAFASAGTVIAQDAESLTVEPLPDCPAWDGMGAYCANRFDSNGENLLGESVTYGHGAGALWQSLRGNLLTLHSPAAAAKVRPGELLSWHQGAKTDFQVYLGHCDNLHLENLRVFNSNGFCFVSENCRNITARRLTFRPDGNRLFTGPRDAWKLFKCGGTIDIDALSIQGVRMDGQNMHSNWLWLRSRLGTGEALFYAKYTHTPILAGSLIELYDGTAMQTRIVSEASVEGKAELGHLYRIRFTEPLPATAKEGALCAARCWEADSYLCRNSHFLNIAGSGHLCRYDNLVLLNNTYRNTMNPGVLLGAEMPTHAEGGHAVNILVKGCAFDNCGFFPRYDTVGCIGIHSYGFDAPLNREILITDNDFQNADCAVHIKTARNVVIWNNRYKDIRERLRLDTASTHSIHNLDS